MKTVTTKEFTYDEMGRVIKEIETVVDLSDYEPATLPPYYPPCTHPYYPTWLDHTVICAPTGSVCT